DQHERSDEGESAPHRWNRRAETSGKARSRIGRMGSPRTGELPTFRTPGPPPRHPDAPYSLVVVEGPDASSRYTLDAHAPIRVLVGTSPMCTFRLTDRAVSRRHASFRLADDELVLADLGSTNGTSVNGVGIREAVLRGGEAVKLGSTVL